MSEKVDLEWLAMVNAYHAWNNTLVGNPAPAVKAMGEELNDPKVGDLVLELTTLRMYPQRQGQLGRLTKIAEEPIMSEAEWLEKNDGEATGELVPTDTYWYVERPNGEEVRWSNAWFIKVPEDTTTNFKRAQEYARADNL